jgi:RNA-directed DNA polymerase
LSKAILFEATVSLPRLLTAALRASRKCQNSSERAQFLLHLDQNCINLREQIQADSYVWGPYTAKTVCDPKRRTIHKAPFRDRVVHQTIADVLNPILERHLIHTTFACRCGKGTNAALEYAMVQAKHYPFALKMDISKYFASVNHALLMEKLARIVPDKRLIALLESLVRSFSPGIPIGNLTSQLFANLYLNDLDQFVKRHLKVKHYLRYMDDMLFFAQEKSTAWQLADEVRACAARHTLDIPPHKTQLFRTQTGVHFLGYRIFSAARPRLLARRLRRLRARLRRAARSPAPTRARRSTIMGWYGSAKYGLSQNLCTDLGIINDLREKMTSSLPDQVAFLALESPR